VATQIGAEEETLTRESESAEEEIGSDEAENEIDEEESGAVESDEEGSGERESEIEIGAQIGVEIAGRLRSDHHLEIGLVEENEIESDEVEKSDQDHEAATGGEVATTDGLALPGVEEQRPQ